MMRLVTATIISISHLLLVPPVVVVDGLTASSSPTSIRANLNLLRQSCSTTNQGGTGRQQRSHLYSSSSTNNNNNENDEDLKLAIARMEKEVRASAQANLDMQTFRKTFALDDLVNEFVKEPLFSSSSSTTTAAAATTTSTSQSSSLEDKVPPSQGRIALAGGLTAGIVSFLLFHQPFLSYMVFFIATYYANRDPIEEFGSTYPSTTTTTTTPDISTQLHSSSASALVPTSTSNTSTSSSTTTPFKAVQDVDEVVGPIARVVGRATLQSFEEHKPKVRAITRAVATGHAEIDELKDEVMNLRDENESLRAWIRSRQLIDDHVGRFKAQELKAIAREEGLTVGGTKRELMMRLVDAGCLDLGTF